MNTVRRNHRRSRVCAVWLFTALAAGCSDEVANISATSAVNTPLSITEATEPDVERTPAPNDRNGIVRWVISEVEAATLYTLSTEQRTCVRAQMLQDVPPPVLDALVDLPSIAALAPDDLAALVVSFDECVTVDQFVDAQVPGMVSFGVPPDQATCVQTRLRTDVGFVGLFRLSLTQAAEAEPQPEAEQAVADVYDACQFDPDDIVPVTEVLTPTTNQPASPVESSAPSSEPDLSMAPPLTAEPAP